MIRIWLILLNHIFLPVSTEKAVEMTWAFCDYYYERLDYYLKQNPYIINSAEFEIQTAIQYTSRVANACAANGKPEMAEEINKKLEELLCHLYYEDGLLQN